MPREVRTNVVIAAETKGLDKALRQTLGLNKEAVEGLKKQAKEFVGVQKEIGGLDSKLSGLTKQQLELSRSMESLGDKATPEYKKLAESLKLVQKESKDVERTIRNLEKAYRAEGDAAKKLGEIQKDLVQQQRQASQQARWAGTQGFMQRAMPGMAPLFLQRGPGMGRQMMGMAAGGMVRRGIGFGRGMAAAPFSGVAGVQQALTALPFGEIAAGQLGASAGYAQQAIQWQRQRQEAMPFIRQRQPPEVEVLEQRKEALAKFERSLETQDMPAARPEAYLMRAANDPKMIFTPQGRYVHEDSKVGKEMLAMAKAEAATAKPGETIRRFWEELAPGETTEEYQQRITSSESTRKRLKGRVEKAQQTVTQELAKSDIGAMGLELRGVARPQAMQEAAAMMQIGGGVYDRGTPAQIQHQQTFMRSAMAARTVYGVGPEVAGRFLQAGRRGGLVGGLDRGGEALTETLADAVSLGLTGSEITAYMQTVATGIQQFQATGIPFNKDSMNSMALEINRAGIAAPRAQAVAQGFQQYIQGMAGRGPTSGLDLLLLREMGGYQGGGAAGYEQALMRMEQMKTTLAGGGGVEAGSAMGQAMQRMMGWEGGESTAGQRMMLFRRLRRMGVNIGLTETSALAKGLTGEEISPEEMKAVERERQGRLAGGGEAGMLAGGPAALEETARAFIGPAVQKQAQIQNMQITAGHKLLNVIQDLEQQAIITNTAFGTLAKGPLTTITGKLGEFTEGLTRVSAVLAGEGGLLSKIGSIVDMFGDSPQSRLEPT